jgi:hypothetical protein
MEGLSRALVEGTTPNTLARGPRSGAQINFTELQPYNISDNTLRKNAMLALAIMSSLLFITSISFAFFGADADEPFFKHMLNGIVETTPGVSLINIDNIMYSLTET